MGCVDTYLGANSIFNGTNNTQTINNSCTDNNIAAKLCTSYSVNENDNTYSDWYLPAIDEINLLYQQKNAVGFSTDEYYWSSTENGKLYAWQQNLKTGEGNYTYKKNLLKIIRIRKF